MSNLLETILESHGGAVVGQFAQFLDTNRDGSIVDDVLDLAKKFL